MEVEQTIFVTHLIITVQLYYRLSKNLSVKIWSNKFQTVMINFELTWERERHGDKFYVLSLNSDTVPALQFQPNFPPFKLLGDFV